jgi:long-chain acyl-CoA synthetase
MKLVAEQDLQLQRLWHWERTRPGELYLTQPLGGGATRPFTWGETVDQARRMAAYLRSFGWEPGSRVALMSKNCAWWLLADYAIWIAGYVSVPIYPSLTAASVRQILDHSGAKLCFVGKLDDWAGMSSGIPDGVERVVLPLGPQDAGPQWEDIIARTAPLPGHPVRAGDDLASIIYTSGTTGTPKGVMHSFETMMVSAQVIGDAFGYNSQDRLISYLPLAHVAERLLVENISLRSGCSVFFSESLETFAQDMQRARPTVFGSVPRIWTKFQQGVLAKIPKAQLDVLLQHPQQGPVVKKQILQQLGLDAVRVCCTGAAPLPADTVRWFRGLGLEMLEILGMTENFALSHCSRVGDRDCGHVGLPWPGVESKFSEIGEILVKSPGNMLGYYKDPEKTREAFTEDGFLRTGDVGELDAQGRLKLTGRAKEQFKTSKGKYVAPAPIENRLGTHPKIEACCVTGVAFPQPFAVLMLSLAEYQRCAEARAREELTRSLADHLEQVNAQLDPHEQMDFVVVVPEQWTVDNGFITPTFKVKRPVIEKHYGPHFEHWAQRRQMVIWQ